MPVAICVLIAIIAFVGGVRIGIFICEEDRKSRPVVPSAPANPSHMLERDRHIPRRLIAALEQERRKALRKNR